MKIKLTLRYVLSVAIIAVIVVTINITIAFLLINNQSKYDQSKYGGNDKITGFVRDFGKYIDLGEDNKLYINNNGKNLIDKSNSWVQILNEDNREVYSYHKPKEIKDKHTTIEIINGYKYAGGLGDTSQILAGYKDIDNVTYTYLIGFPSNIIKKNIFITETTTTNSYIKSGIIAIIIVDFIIAIIFGYIFSKGLTKPVKNIIDSVDHLYEGNYEVYFKEKGLYINVFKKLNILSYKLKENELERKKIDKMRDEWVANISHDIKTPLSSIKGYAEFLEQDYDFSRDDIKSFANIIHNKSDYIKELVEDLNLNIQLKNNISILKKEKVNIVSLVKDSVIDILNDSKYSKVDIRFECSEDKIFIDIDKVLMKRVLNNLIYNALVHNDENISIVVSVYKNDKTYISISDNGKGISESDLENIFDRYYRGTNTGEAHKGSGLGMSIAKEIVNAHNGDITINSVLGKGTDIKIIL
ncbi:UNVERIFIED_CONTAM: sensor histidine kinase [Clostridioides difficile]|uniref:sensor histidine kinase n=1 Tax=Clostridioides difficile TaxID=1496 RepID=UPI00038D38EE|nr:HAMP domain-containing sensor histidine kinase [Clostridioides difficile]EQE83440.1 his Kinase A domain protein [Clostridioides difficile CD69]OYO89368.1 two-component sensor histidine kinase [Clostridioides difficile]HBF7936531.1 HAMP domain-containing histidine kinase [Clostridioides difficile]HBG6489836.1 HAMP domain-containing histidine kinase [Clostridioides difficile]HBY2624142.1 HAMP domain-containing histidine kinase [Clostridioides difficile]